MKRLLADILNEEYSTLVRPVVNVENKTRVTMSMGINQILELVSHTSHVH